MDKAINVIGSNMPNTYQGKCRANVERHFVHWIRRISLFRVKVFIEYALTMNQLNKHGKIISRNGTDGSVTMELPKTFDIAILREIQGVTKVEPV